jgi:hypothetical protein
MQNAFRDVLLFCPEVRTGGPEALHQLAYQIARRGGRARMVYYGPHSRLEIEGDRLRCLAEGSPMLTDFARYHPRPLREARIGPDTLVVFPEPLSQFAAARGAVYQRALWWLSLDNVFAQNPALRDPDYRRRFFADSNLVHFHQSEYARRFLQDNGATSCFPLSDYTDPDFVHRGQIASDTPPVTARPPAICYFPNKGGPLAARFIENAGLIGHPASFVPIRGMSKAQVRDALFTAPLYIDFGPHPGKDRVPREAAIAGAVVLLHAAGAATCFADHPLPPDYLFTEEDVESGRLHARVGAILHDPAPHAAAQAHYRQAILLERERFDLEVRAFFFHGL